MEPLIAIFFDCDGTLSDDSTDFLLRKHGVNPRKFWHEVDQMVLDGWDPSLAYMTRVIDLAKEKHITRSSMRRVGATVPLFKGVPAVFQQLHKFIKRKNELRQARIELEYYLISGGFQQVLEAMPLAKHVTAIFGCDYNYDNKTGLPISIKRSITFTEKTKFIFAVNKGITPEELLTQPYRVNDAIEEADRRVPFSQMIYLGDGPSDIPCFSTIMKLGGRGIGVYRKGTSAKGYELSKGKRITAGPFTADYSLGSNLMEYIEQTILDIGYEIAVKRKLTFRKAPSH
jgi:phosphoglycolate phosphatase-like HAD superfamily hydrolase